jgi:hypothetical protein
MSNFIDFIVKCIIAGIYLIIAIGAIASFEEPIGSLCGFFLGFINLCFIWPGLWAIPEGIFMFFFNLIFAP